MKRLSVEFKFLPRQATHKHLKDEPPGLLPVIPRSLASESFLARSLPGLLPSHSSLARTHALRKLTRSLARTHARTHADTLSPCLARTDARQYTVSLSRTHARTQIHCFPDSHAVRHPGSI